MNPEELRKLSFGDLLDEFICYLEHKSYNQLTLVNYRRTIRKIEAFMFKHGIDAYTPEVGMQYYEIYLVKNALGILRQKAIFTAIRRLNDFYSGVEYRIQRKNEINLLPDSYEHALDMFARECVEAGNKHITIESKKQFARSFLKKCIAIGCPDIQSLNPAYITRACLAVENKDGWAVIRAFLKFLSTRGTTASDFSTLVPSYRRPIGHIFFPHLIRWNQ